MRLVDAENLMLCITKEYNRRGTGDGLRLAWIEKAVNDATTITPDMAQVLAYECGKAERKRGRWIHDGYDIPHGVDWMHCSVCGRREPHVPAAMTHFCPSCGADMRGEANERTEVCNLQE